MSGLFDAETAAVCKPHERRWRNFCVDRGLKDAWLERLNKLAVFELISICEGHPDDPAIRRRFPHINLRVRERYVVEIVENWERLRTDIRARIGDSFNGRRFTGHFEIRSGYASDTAGNERVEAGMLKISVRFDVLKATEGFGEEWFEDSISSAERFDAEMLKILAAADRS